MQSEKTVQERVTEYLDMFVESAGQIVDQHGQEVVDLALLYARVDAASGLVAPLAWVILGAVMWSHFAERLRDWSSDAEKKMNPGDEGFPTSLSVGLRMLLLLPGFIGLLYMLNFWRWAGIFMPEVWIIHRVVESTL